MARTAGYYGWPYFIGDTKPYAPHDFATGKTGAFFKDGGALNTSPNNTGIAEIPPAHKALLWYPYGGSPEFPALGSGGRSAMAGPLYRWNASRKEGLPKYFDGKLIIYDWMRNWMKLVTIDGKDQAGSIEPFLGNQHFNHPMDLEAGADGRLYLLEYGSKWLGNTDGSLKVISYLGVNRKPEAHFATSRTDGPLPLAVQFDSSKSSDKDPGDTLAYEWSFTGGTVQSRLPNPTFTFDKAGKYDVRLKVTDNMGQSSIATQSIFAGNTRPQVSLKMAGDLTQLHWGDELHYTVDASDAEDGTVANGGIKADRIAVTARFEPTGDIVASANTRGLDPTLPGTAMISASTCMACHQVETQSVGPAFRQVALKYRNDPAANERLANKVIQGGVGVWGHTPMPGQVQHTLEQTRQMVAAVLKAGDSSEIVAQGKDGVLRLPPQPPTKEQSAGRFVVQASYEDRGAPGASPLKGESATVTVSPKFIYQITNEGTLGYLDVEIKGDGPRVAPETGAGIGYYSNPKATLQWKANFPQPGNYQVFLTQAVIAPHDGSTYTIGIGDQKVPGTIIATPRLEQLRGSPRRHPQGRQSWSTGNRLLPGRDEERLHFQHPIDPLQTHPRPLDRQAGWAEALPSPTPLHCCPKSR